MGAKEEREEWLTVLDHRAQRFSKLVALRAPDYILCSDLLLLVEAVAGLAPGAYGQVVAEKEQKRARVAFSRCVFCGAQHGRQGEDWCETCQEQARKDAEADDEAEPVRGQED